MESYIPWIVAAVIISLVIFQLRRMTYGYRKYLERPSQEARWRMALPIPEHILIAEQVLEGICRSFMFPVKAKWQFKPEDKLADIFDATDNNQTEHLQYDMLFVALQDIGFNERPNFEDINIQTLVELAIAGAA